MSKGSGGMPEYWLDLVTDTLAQLDVGARGAFLQKFLQSLVGRGVSEEESITYWEGILARQIQWAEKLGRPVTLRTAVVDYVEDLRILRNPVLMEYDELKKLRHNAATDSLTGLNNRRMFEEYLVQEIDRSTRYGSAFALLSFDLRSFKSVNDIYGHAAGDEILRCLARASIENLRGSDIPCRVGGTSLRSFFLKPTDPERRCWLDELHPNSKSPPVPLPQACRWGLIMELPFSLRMERTRPA